MAMKSLFFTVLAGLPALYQGTVSSIDFDFAMRLIVALTAQTPVSISLSSSPSQIVNGIGASGAWWPIDLASFPDSARSQAAKLLFDSSASQAGGAGLTSFRYNVGGGGVGVTNPRFASCNSFNHRLGV